MAHLYSPAETDLAKALCEVAGIDSRRVVRAEIVMEVNCLTVVRLTVLVVDNEAPVKEMQARLHEFKLIPLEA